jgi:hypothetical protein
MKGKNILMIKRGSLLGELRYTLSDTNLFIDNQQKLALAMGEYEI